MKRLLVTLGLFVSLFSVAGCTITKEVVDDIETSTRYRNVSIIETTANKYTDDDGVRWKEGAIQVSVDAYSPNANIYVMVVEAGGKAPTNDQLKAGKDYSGADLLVAYNGIGSLYRVIKEESFATGNVSFTNGDSFDCYAVIENGGKFAGLTYSTTVNTLQGFSLRDRGAGTETDPYLISTVEELEAVNFVTTERQNAESAFYLLENNIDLSQDYNKDEYDRWAELNDGYRDGYGSWLPLGQQTGSRRKFMGVFDGGGYTINGLFQRTAIEGSGLFSELDVNGIIKNLTLTNVDIYTTTQRTAAVCGYSKGTIESVNVLGGKIESSTRRAGGISGQMYEAGTITGCYVDTEIYAVANSADSNSGKDIGGIVGQTTAGNNPLYIENCQFAGSVSGGADVGGIAGEITGTYVRFCSTYGATVKGSGQVGGVVGNMGASTVRQNIVEYCFAYNVTLGRVSGSGTNYAIVAKVSSTTKEGVTYYGGNGTNLYYCGVTNGSSSVGTSASNGSYSAVATSKTSSELLSVDFVTNTLKLTSVMYVISEGQMPILKTVSSKLDETYEWDEVTG